MSEYTQEERDRALAHAIMRVSWNECENDAEAGLILQDCIALPKSRVEQYERALWELMKDANYGRLFIHERFRNTHFFVEIGYMKPGSLGFAIDWTEKAHAFAQQMKTRGK